MTQTSDPGIVPALAIGLFAGLRRSEFFSLDWSEVDLENRTIEVKGIKAKTRQRRLVHIADNLVTWLAPHQKSTGPLMPERNIDVFSQRLRGLAQKAPSIRGRIMPCATVSVATSWAKRRTKTLPPPRWETRPGWSSDATALLSRTLRSRSTGVSVQPMLDKVAGGVQSIQVRLYSPGVLGRSKGQRYLRLSRGGLRRRKKTRHIFRRRKMR